MPERLDALSRQLFPSDENHCGISGSSSEASLVPVTNGSSGEMILKARTLGLERDGTAGGGFVIDYEVDISVKAMESLVPAMVYMRRDEEVLQHVMPHQRNAAKLSQSGRVTAEIHVVHPFWTFRSAFCEGGSIRCGPEPNVHLYRRRRFVPPTPAGSSGICVRNKIDDQ